MSTIIDVAKKANVSVTTVSRVMNNKGYISEETRKKVTDAIASLDYHPSHSARSLSKKQTFILGLILPDCSHPFFSEMIKYVELTADSHGYTIMYCNSMNEKDKEIVFINMLKEKRIDGLIMGSHNLEPSVYATLDRPLVTFERYIDESIPYVTCDNYTGGLLATQHLIEKGCQNLLHISGSLSLDIYSNQRLSGFYRACEKKDVQSTHLEINTLNLDFYSFYEFIERRLGSTLTNYDGVFCSSDLLAYSLYVYCINNHIRVPEDIKIVGFDNDYFTRNMQFPKLTTIQQPIHEISETLVNNIIALIEDQPNINNSQFNVKLIEGTTT